MDEDAHYQQEWERYWGDEEDSEPLDTSDHDITDHKEQS